VDTTANRDALSILRTVVLARLATLAPSTLPGGAHWRINLLDQARKLPMAIAQPQGAGAARPFVGREGWQGVLVVKALAHTQDAADTCAASLHDVVVGTHTHSGAVGWDITITLDRPLLLDVPIGSSAQQAGHQYTVAIHRRT
jgi:hypothetical protein